MQTSSHSTPFYLQMSSAASIFCRVWPRLTRHRSLVAKKPGRSPFHTGYALGWIKFEKSGIQVDARRRTEGWPGGLLLATIALPRTCDRQDSWDGMRLSGPAVVRRARSGVVRFASVRTVVSPVDGAISLFAFAHPVFPPRCMSRNRAAPRSTLARQARLQATGWDACAHRGLARVPSHRLSSVRRPLCYRA